MTDQPKWSSSRVAQARAAQQPSRGGTQQSRWATPAPSTKDTGPSASSWRTSSSAASSTSRPTQTSLSSSRWAVTVPATPVSSLTESLQRTKLDDSTPSPPTIHVESSAAPPRTPSSSKPEALRQDGLTVRSASRPLGGKSLDRLALLASPSRGLDAAEALSTDLSAQGSMDLTCASVQSEFRDYISDRINKVLPLLLPNSLSALKSSTYLPEQNGKRATKTSEAEEELQQILLLVRKLREALVASRRIDEFAVEVYELSAYLAVLVGEMTQLAATLPRVVLELYPSVPSTSTRRQHEDVRRLMSELNLLTAQGREEEARGRIVSLYLLQTLCLSGRATRLGQYAANDPASPLEQVHRGFKEYRTLRSTLSSIYGSELKAHLAFCDQVYSSLRGVNPCAFAQSLESKDASGYHVDAWQRLLLLQVVPVLRGAAWAVARRTYMYLPIRENLAHMILGSSMEGSQEKKNAVGERYLGELLLLGTAILPPAQTKQDADRAIEETPEDWDTQESQTSQSIPIDPRDEEEENRRLHTFLTTQFSTDLTSRLTSIQSGHALKLR